VGVRHTESNLIIWSAFAPDESESQSTSQSTLQSTTTPAAPTAFASAEALTSIFDADQLYDAGDKGCAYGPLTEISVRLKGMESGQTLEIRATDPTVSVDLSAWCRMTGHKLVEQRADRYLVRHSI